MMVCFTDLSQVVGQNIIGLIGDQTFLATSNKWSFETSTNNLKPTITAFGCHWRNERMIFGVFFKVKNR